MSLYGCEFYENRHDRTRDAAEIVLGHLQAIIPPIRSAVDFGCGVGTWLSVLKSRGARKVLGVEGPWVDLEKLEIDNENLILHDFSQGCCLRIDDTFDLAISLEVAEHLPPHFACDFASQLTNRSDFVLFSAAVPLQGGVGHVNEQWPPYWISIFDSLGFVALDVIRKKIWDDDRIPIWYRQNTLLFVRKERLGELNLIPDISDHLPPEEYLLYLRRMIHNPGLKQSSRFLAESVKRHLRRIFSRLVGRQKR